MLSKAESSENGATRWKCSKTLNFDFCRRWKGKWDRVKNFSFLSLFYWFLINGPLLYVEVILSYIYNKAPLSWQLHAFFALKYPEVLWPTSSGMHLFLQRINHKGWSMFLAVWFHIKGASIIMYKINTPSGRRNVWAKAVTYKGIMNMWQFYHNLFFEFLNS